MDLLHPPLEPVLSRYALLPREHALLWPRNSAGSRPGHHVRHRTQPGLRPRSAHRAAALALLFTNCVLALDVATGQRKWHYQFTPHDVRDWDATEPNVLVDTTYRGQTRKLLLHADRNGFFYVVDHQKGDLLLAKSFMRKLTWASGIGPDGRPIRLKETDVSCPEHATNWNGTAYSPVTRLYYVMASERCAAKLRALDDPGQIAWEVPQIGPIDGKRVAGGLIFYGDPSGYLIAADERNGKTLWRIPLNATIKTSPMTYSIGAEQFITLAVGSNIMTFGLPAN